ncbi:MAG: RNA polymerase sigma factor [Bacteroidota bacterium]
MNPFDLNYQTDEEDKSLIGKAVKGDRKALEDLLKKHQPYIFNIAWKMVQRADDAQDITQEVLIKITTKLSQFKGDSEFRTWLYRIVVNHFLKMKKKPREEMFTEGFGAHAERLDGIPDVALTEMEQQEKEAEIRELNLGCMAGMLLCLTREQRMAYILGELFGADHTVGSEILGISKQNFRVRLSRARKDLQSFMNDRCGLVNKANPCRCYKKVTTLLDAKLIDSKNLLFNRKEYGNYKKYIRKASDEAWDLVEEKVHELHAGFTFKEQFDKKTFLDGVISNEKVVQLFNLN